MIDDYFEWDDVKNAANLRKHGIGFAEARTVFDDPFVAVIPDPDHSGEEDRFIALGQSSRRLLLVVIHVERGRKIRIVSARRATRRERKDYEENNR